jgi:hypothetical protein
VELATNVDLIFPGRVELCSARGGGDDARWCGFVGEGIGGDGHQGMTTVQQWWQRAAAAVKDRRSLYLTRVVAPRRCPDLEAAVIRGARVAAGAAPAHVGARAPGGSDPVLGRGAQGVDAPARSAPPL